MVNSAIKAASTLRDLELSFRLLQSSRPLRIAMAAKVADQLMLITVLIAVCLIGCIRSQAVQAKIYPCHNLEAKVSHFEMYERMELCCRFLPKECNNTDLNDTLTLSRFNMEEHRGNLSRPSPCIVRLDIENASDLDEGHYACYKNNQPYAIEDIKVFERLTEPEIKDFTVTPKNSMNLIFCLGNQSQVFYEVELRDYLNKRNVTFDCGEKNLQCPLCKYVESEEKLQIPSLQTVTVIVKLLRSIQRLETMHNFSVMAHIVPQPLKDLTVTSITPSDAVFQFCMESATRRLVNQMKHVMSPLKFHVQVDRMQGIPQQLRVDLDADYYWSCVAVKLENLTAFTMYHVSVSGSGGGGESLVSMTNFTSGKAVPANPPHIDGFSYIRDTVEDDQGNPKPALVLYWEQLPHADRGGSQVTYTLELIIEKDYSQVRKNIPQIFKVITLEFVKNNLTVRIWAENEIGTSENYSEISIPAEKEVVETPVSYVEVNEDKARVLLKLKDQHSQTAVEKVAIHWCQEKRLESINSLDVCEEYPKTDVDVLKEEYQISLTEEIVHEETKQETTIWYYYTEDGDNEDSETASAIITLYPDNTRNLNSPSRRRRSTEMNSVHDKSTSLAVEHMSQYTASTESPSDSSISFDPYPIVTQLPLGGLKTSGGSYLLVFVSFYQNGVWTGMVRTKCNYDRALTDVDLTLTQNITGSKIFLQWKQTCDITQKQFLADGFRVSTSSDIDCEFIDEGFEVKNITNGIFSMSQVEIPAGKKFACVWAHRRSSSNQTEYTSKAFVQPINTPDAGNSSTGSDKIMIVVSVVSAVFFIIVAALIAVYCIKYNHKKRKQFRRLLSVESLCPQSSDISPIRTSQNGFKRIPDPPLQGSTVPPLPARMISKVESNANDSGTGTVGSNETDKQVGHVNTSSDGSNLPVRGAQGVTNNLERWNRPSLPLSDAETLQNGVQKIEMSDLGNNRSQGDREESNFHDDKSERSRGLSCEDDEGEELGGEPSQEEACRRQGITFDPNDVSLKSESDESSGSGEDEEGYNSSGIVKDKSGSDSSGLGKDKSGSDSSDLDKDKNNTSVGLHSGSASDSGCDSRGKTSAGSSVVTNSKEDLNFQTGTAESERLRDDLELNCANEDLKDLNCIDNGKEKFNLTNCDSKFNCAQHNEGDVNDGNCVERLVSRNMNHMGNGGHKMFDTTNESNNFNEKNQQFSSQFSIDELECLENLKSGEKGNSETEGTDPGHPLIV